MEKEVETLYEENDILRYALSREVEGQILTEQETLYQLAVGVTLTMGGRTVAFRLSDDTGTELGGNHSLPPELDAYPMISGLPESRRGWMLNRVAEGAFVLHGASALTLMDKAVYLENCRDVSALFSQRSDQQWPSR